MGGDPKRLVNGVVDVVIAQRNGTAIHGFRLIGVILEIPGSALNFPFGFRQGFAGFQGQNRGDFIAVCQQVIAHFPYQPAPFNRTHGGQYAAVMTFTGGGDRSINVCRAGQTDIGNLAQISRVFDTQITTLAGMPPAIDIVVPLGR